MARIRRYSARDARRDIAAKSNAKINRESAQKWLALAVEAFRRHRAGDGADFLRDACDYGDEALEHAARVGDYGELVGTVQRRLEAVRPRSR